MFDIIKTSNVGTLKINPLVTSVSAFAIAASLLFVGAPSVQAAQDGITRLIAVTQMKASSGTEELQQKEGQVQQTESLEKMQARDTAVIPPTTEEIQQQKLPGRTGKAQTKKKMDGIGVQQME